MHVTYVNTERPRVTRDELRSKGCSRRINGLAAEDENCCEQCRALIHSTKPIEYHIRDRFGRVLTADWLIQ
jgi:hypothetical protein